MTTALETARGISRVAYAAAQAADDAWSAELYRLFGKHACNARYQPRGKGEPGTELRRLHEDFRTTSEALHAAWVAVRQAQRAEG
jgi:hypothetical protein